MLATFELGFAELGYGNGGYANKGPQLRWQAELVKESLAVTT